LSLSPNTTLEIGSSRTLVVDCAPPDIFALSGEHAGGVPVAITIAHDTALDIFGVVGAVSLFVVAVFRIAGYCMNADAPATFEVALAI
jgi:hypothetical protein